MAKKKTVTTKAQRDRDEMARRVNLACAAVDALIDKVTTLEDTSESIMLAGEQLEKLLATQTSKITEEVRLIGDEQDKQANQIDRLVSGMRQHRRMHRVNANYRKRIREKFEGTTEAQIVSLGKRLAERIDTQDREQETTTHARIKLEQQASCGLHGHGPIELFGIRRSRMTRKPIFGFRCQNCKAQYEVEDRGKLSRAERRMVRALSRKPGTLSTGG